MEQTQITNTANQSASRSPRVADIIVETLKSFGVRYVFGIPGTQVNPIVDALRRGSSKDQEESVPRFILVRDEGAAAVMATIVSRLTEKLGACLGMGAPGAVKLINGLYNAKLDGTPVIAISGQVKTSHMGLEYTQEIDLSSLFNPVSVYNQLLLSPENCGLLVSTACKHALELRGVAHLCVPEDIQEMEVSAKDQRKMMKKPRLAATHKQVPDPDRLSEAARTLIGASKVVIVAGRGASGCGSLIGPLSEKLHAPVFTTFPGRDALRSDHPNNMGVAWIFSPKIGRCYPKSRRYFVPWH